jgi:ABC-type transport system substrate-binding protein
MDFARPSAERIRYDPEEARKLLAASGWVKKDEEGYLVDKDGKRFPTIVFEYSSSSSQRIHDVVRNDLWNEAGIEMRLKLVNDTALSKKMWEYKYDLFYINWTASRFPAPEFSWRSAYADLPRTNNMPGFKNEEADRIIEAYKIEFDGKKRTKMLQRLDEIFFDAHPYALSWYGPYFRIIYWDKFGHPPEYSSRFAAHIRNVIYFWWFDPDREARTEENMRRGVSNYPDRPDGQYDEVDQKYWLFNADPKPDHAEDE